MTQQPPDPFKPTPVDPPPTEPRPALPLDYGHLAPSPAGSWAAFFARMVAGFVGYIFLSLLWFRLASGWRNPGVTLIGWFVLTFLLIALASHVSLRYGRRGYGWGIALVFVCLGGVALLIIGLCWR